MLGNLTYTYDLNGNRTALDGSWGRTGLPSALLAASYDAANQIATWASTSFTYDANGNLTSDGATTYTWNARNRLTGVSGSVSASFQYDGIGRRRSKTVSGTSTGFLYDRLNVVQEISGGSPSANLLSGLAVDEWFGRTDVGGTRLFLVDGLKNTTSLTDPSGTVLTEYTYEPFGRVTLSGSSSSNSFLYTGREQDGTGLSYYRARYLHAQLQRFVNEDPIEIFGGLNLHAYVANNPLNASDPLGLQEILLGTSEPWLPREVAGRITRGVRPGPAPPIRPGNWTEPQLEEIVRPRTPTDSPDIWEKVGDLLRELMERIEPGSPGSAPPFDFDGRCGKSSKKCEPPPPPCYFKGLCLKS